MGQGFVFTAVAYSQALPGAVHNQTRYIFAIDPERAEGRHLYGVWASLQEKELRSNPPAGNAREGFEARARGPVRPEKPQWPFQDAWADPWYDGQNYNGTIIDTPNIGTLLGGAGTAADLDDDPVARVLQQEVELAVFTSHFTVLDLPAQETGPRAREATIGIQDVLELAVPPPTGCLRFVRVPLQPDLLMTKPGVAFQVGRALWRVLDADNSEGRPEEVLADHMVVDAETVTVWSRRGIAIAEKCGTCSIHPAPTCAPIKCSGLSASPVRSRRCFGAPTRIMCTSRTFARERI